MRMARQRGADTAQNAACFSAVGSRTTVADATVFAADMETSTIVLFIIQMIYIRPRWRRRHGDVISCLDVRKVPMVSAPVRHHATHL